MKNFKSSSFCNILTFHNGFLTNLRVSFEADNFQMLSITKAEPNLPDAYKKGAYIPNSGINWLQ